MHTFTSSDNYHFHFNGDFSGDILITKNDSDVETVISSQSMLEYMRFVAESILTEKIEDIL